MTKQTQRSKTQRTTRAGTPAVQPPGTRDIILNTAELIVARAGAAALTIDAVARESQVSKGGVLYHFASKEALVQGMMDRYLAEIDAELAQREQAERGAGAFTRAYVRLNFDAAREEATADMALQHELAQTGRNVFDANAAVLAALFSYPELLAPARERAQAWQQRIEQDGMDAVQATVARLAADGLFWNEVLGLGSLKPHLRERVQRALLALTASANTKRGGAR